MKLRQYGAALFALLLVASTASVAAAAMIDSPDRFAFGEDTVPDPNIDADVTKDTHTVGWDATEYEDNSGEIEELNASVNSSNANPHTLIASDINASEYGEFPRKSDEDGDNSVSALDASEWTTDASGTAGSASKTDTTTAPGVDAVEFSTSSQTSGDTAKFTYSNFSVNSDVDKRYVQIVGDATTLDSGAEVMIRFEDSDSDYVEIDGQSGLLESNSTVLFNATGEGDVVQEQVGSMTVEGSGDGSMSSITQVTVVIEDANAAVQIAGLNAEKLSEWTLGTERVDSDGDGEPDSSETITEPHGSYTVESLGASTFSSAFDDARLKSVTTDMRFGASDLTEEMDAEANVTDAESYPSYAYKADLYFRLQLPDAYDLSYSNAELEATVELPDERYKTVRTSEEVSDVGFENISSWSDHTSSFTGQDSTVVLDGTVSPGDQIAVNFEEVVTEDERTNMFTAGGAAGQFERDSGGGGIFGQILGAIGAILGGSWLLGKRSSGS